MATSAELILAIGQADKDPTFKKRTTDIYAQLVTDQQDELNEEFELLKKVDITSLTLTASTELVGNMPSDFVFFSQKDIALKRGMVAVGDNGKFPLEMTSIAELDAASAGWREADAGAPSHFYLVEGASVELHVWPKPSATWITDNGDDVYLHFVLQPSAISYAAGSPFNSATRLRGLGKLLKLMALRQIAVEDVDQVKFTFYDAQVKEEKDRHSEIFGNIDDDPGDIGFDRRYRQDP